MTNPVNSVQQDVSKVETAVKSAVATVQTDEGKLSRTQLAWVGAGLGFAFFPIAYEIVKHLL